jgi:Rrf2 family iron-sulfur cluster assembly transcriptional regulator
MVLSKSCNYALRAVLYIAARDAGEFIPIQEISQALGISFHFLTKTLQTLTQRQILISNRGPRGGVALARPVESITLMEVILAIDGRDLFDGCVLGLDSCNADRPCPLHSQWQEVKAPIREMFEQTSVADVARQMRRWGWRLADGVK